MFDRIAPRYDFLNRLLSMRQDQRWRKHLIKRIPVQNGGYFLDVATGTGDVLIQAIQSRPEYTQFTGVDISAAMLEHARQKLAKDQSHITLKKMSACHLEIKSDSVDCITISFGLRNVSDKPQALREFYRCLKPGGRLLILEFFKAPQSIRQQFFNFYFNHILPVIGGIFSDRTAYKYLPQSVGDFYSVPQIQSFAKEVGFTPGYTRTFLFGVCSLVELNRS